VQSSSTLDVQSIERHLTTRTLGHRIELHDRLDSTNREAVALAQSGVEHGTLILAESQTAGRGRMGRPWFSPPGVNIYGSLVIRTPVDAHRLSSWLSWLPLMAALGAAEAIEADGGATIAVKWPNDLLMRERKVGGILGESGTCATSGPFQVIGIGINVNGAREEFPTQFRDTATTIRHETGSRLDRNRLIATWLNQLESCLEKFLAHGCEDIAVAYVRRCATIGRNVRALLADGQECVGVAAGIQSDGSLTLTWASQPGSHHAPAVRQLRVADIVHLR
jgi:BirA family transcriptional regulator, biotin operon repressor / biotin---[acetyl-CoA-carboxylase] ligase